IKESGTSRGLSKKETEEVAEAVGIGAIKYGFLKVGRTSDIQFDINESLSLEGNSGPYLQYTYARTQSVLLKAKKEIYKDIKADQDFNEPERNVMRTLTRFSETTIDAAKNYSPNLLCNYLFDLAQKYNNFYNQHRIIGSENEKFRLLLTTATGQVLKNGLALLGIQTPERM
ncbi:MAG: DALR anticodon-binding domain-containing protein, partial [Microgenomates group bacterium]